MGIYLTPDSWETVERIVPCPKIMGLDKYDRLLKEYAEKYNLNMKMGVISSNNVIHCNRARYDKSQEN